MKKTLVAIAVLGAFTAQAEYNIIISQENNDYQTFRNETNVSEWTTYNTICNNDIEQSDIYAGFSEQQTTSCYDEQSRTVTQKKIYQDREEVISVDTEYQNTESIDTTQTISGTHVEDSCAGALSFNPAFLNQDGNYPISVNGHGFTAICDMTTDGGGWTKVSNVPAMAKVLESSSWISTGYLLNNTGASMAMKFFNETNPEAILFKNEGDSSAYGKDDLIVVTRSGSTWNWTPGNHNSDTGQTGRFYDQSVNSWSNLGTVLYSSHRDEPWQSSPFSFAINGMLNEYSGNYESRLILGGTFIAGNGGGDSSHVWYNFYGNIYSEDPVTNGDWRTHGGGAIWMK